MAGEQTRFATGNNAAKKYTLEDARRIFRETLDEIEADDTIRFLNTALNRKGYYAQLLKYLVNIYARDEEIVVLSQRIESWLAARLAEGAMEGKIKEASGIFLLKANHGMRETQVMVTASEESSASPEQQLLDNLPIETLEKIHALIAEAKTNELPAH